MFNREKNSEAMRLLSSQTVVWVSIRFYVQHSEMVKLKSQSGRTVQNTLKGKLLSVFDTLIAISSKAGY